jgi:hypothetical protein
MTILSLILGAFTWLGGIFCAAGAVLSALWVIDFTVNRVLRALDWWGAFVRFLWLDSKKKQVLREEHERAKRGERP